jgi:2-phosphosulfolactate phosphatase
MIIHTVRGIEGACMATGVVVVIDVMRAFTTAAYAFAAGISDIELVATVDEALAIPGFRMGEVGGRLIPGFDHNNSPSQLRETRLTGRAVQRTGAGTQCVVAAVHATEVWLASLVVASATARALSGRSEVTLVASAAPPEGAEDVVCAELLSSMLLDQPYSFESVVADVRASVAAQRHRKGDPDLPLEDVDCAVAIDAFDFAMRVERGDGRLVAVPCRL